MSFLYPRTITIKRPGAQPASVGFQGQSPSSQRALETDVVASPGIPAGIQFKKRQGSNPPGLPADTDVSEWEILIPRVSLARGSVQDNDVVIDDLGERYQVFANYWNSLGYALRCQKQKA